MKRIKKLFKRDNNSEVTYEHFTSYLVYEYDISCNSKVWKVNSFNRKGRYYRMK